MPDTASILVNGEWLETDDKHEVVDPYTGEMAGVISLASGKEVEAALVAARDAFPKMRRLQSYERSRLLAGVAVSLRSHREDLAEAVTAETAKPISFSLGEVDRAAATFRLAAEEAKRIGGEVIPMDLQESSRERAGIVQRFPIGPIVAITRFGFPLNDAAHKIAPALAAGNPVVLKPSTRAPLAALRLCQFCQDEGLPPGAINVVPCPRTLVRRLVADDRAKMLSFSGTAAVGWELKSVAGKKRVALEVGGNAAVVVEPDADLAAAAERTCLGAFAFSGQVAVSVQRVFAHKRVYLEFERLLLAAVRNSIVVGDPRDPATIVGPLINPESADRVSEWIAEAVDGGAKVLAGGTRRGTTIDPTVLSNVSHSARVWREEVFGPVLVLEAYDDFGEAIHLVNDTPYGLQAGLFTNDVRKIYAAFRQIDVGTLIVNDCPTYRVDHMPYGGTKDSGLGRSGVRYAIEQMTEPRLLVLNIL